MLEEKKKVLYAFFFFILFFLFMLKGRKMFQCLKSNALINFNLSYLVLFFFGGGVLVIFYSCIYKKKIKNGSKGNNDLRNAFVLKCINIYI